MKNCKYQPTASRIISGSNCRHLNKLQTEEARRSIRSAYHGLPAKFNTSPEITVASQSFLKVRFFRAVQGIIRDECLHLVTKGSGSLSFGTFAKTIILAKRGGMKRRQLEKKRPAPLVADGAIFLGTPGPPLVEHAVQRPVQHRPRAPSHRCLSPAARTACSVELVSRDYLRKCRESSYIRISPGSNT